MTDISQYKELFLSSSQQLLKELTEDSAVLKNQGSNEALERFHRNAHSLKSECLAMGFTQTGNLCKALEHLTQAVIEKKAEITLEIRTIVDKSLNELSSSIELIAQNGHEKDLSESIKSVETQLANFQQNTL